jgi:P2-related tail formation protein
VRTKTVDWPIWVRKARPHFLKLNVIIIQKIVDQKKKFALERETLGEYADNIIFPFGVSRFLANQKLSFFKKFHNYHRFQMLKNR